MIPALLATRIATDISARAALNIANNTMVQASARNRKSTRGSEKNTIESRVVRVVDGKAIHCTPEYAAKIDAFQQK